MSLGRIAVMLLLSRYGCAQKLESQALAYDDECTFSDCTVSALQIRHERLGAYEASTIDALQLRGERLETYEASSPHTYIERSAVADEGAGIGECRGGDRWGKGCTNVEGCKRLCDENPSCWSFSFGVGGVQEGKCYLKSKKVTATDSSSRKPGHSDWRTYYRISYQGSGGHTSQQRYYGGNDQQAPQRTTEDAVAEAEARARVAEARAAEAEARARATEAEARHAAPPSQFASSTAAPDFSRMMDPKTWSDPEALKKMGDFWKGLAGR